MTQEDDLLRSFAIVWQGPAHPATRHTNFQLVTSPIIAAQPASAPSVDELCRTHLALVHHEVRSISMRLPGHVHTDDLTSAGMSALFGAAGSFDPELGVPFARYAARRIRGALLDELRSADWATRSLRGRVRERNAMYESLAAHLRAHPVAGRAGRRPRHQPGRAPADRGRPAPVRRPADRPPGHRGRRRRDPAVHRRDPRVGPGRARAPVLPARRRRTRCPSGCRRSSAPASSRTGRCGSSPRSSGSPSRGSPSCGPRR